MTSSISDRLFSAARIRIYGLALVLGYLFSFLRLFLTGNWLVDKSGHPEAIDFAWIWTAGKLVVAGQAARAFDYRFFSAAQMPIAGPPRADFDYFHWIYPPSLFFYLAPLGLLPYYPAFIAWTASTLALYVAAIRAILSRRAASFLALTPVPVAVNIEFGHTGCLAAGLMGFALVLIETSPFCGGLVLGLLSYKPQLGLLFPLALLAAGQWRALCGAALSTILLILASGWAFGFETWLDFLASLRAVDPHTLMPDANLVATLQTAFGVVRWAEGSLPLAWTAQGVVSVTVAISVCLIWRRNLPYALKAAALAVGALMVTPYLLAYDLTVFSVAVAFLLREALQNGFLPGERPVLLAVFLLLFLYAVPIGPFALAAVLGLIWRRAMLPASADPIEHREQAKGHQPA
jgi:arabinofuranan 3-O-arabinosyltransferase